MFERNSSPLVTRLFTWGLTLEHLDPRLEDREFGAWSGRVRRGPQGSGRWKWPLTSGVEGR